MLTLESRSILVMKRGGLMLRTMPNSYYQEHLLTLPDKHRDSRVSINEHKW